MSGRVKNWYVDAICGEVLLGLSNRILTKSGSDNVSGSAIIGVYGSIGGITSLNIRITVIINNNGF